MMDDNLKTKPPNTNLLKLRDFMEEEMEKTSKQFKNLAHDVTETKLDTLQLLDKWLKPIEPSGNLEFSVTNVINAMTDKTKWDWDIDEKALTEWAIAKFEGARNIEVSEGSGDIADDDNFLDWIVTVSY